MMRASWKAYLLSILVLGGGLSVLRASYTPASRVQGSSSVKKEEPTIVEVDQKLREQNLQIARSAESALYLSRDIAEIERRLSDGTDLKATDRLIKSGIFLLDREALKGYTPGDQLRLYTAFLGFIKKNGAGSKGRSAHSAALAIRLLSKLEQPDRSSAEYAGTLELLDPVHDSRRTLLVVELLTRWNPLPKEARAWIEKDLVSTDAHTSRSAIGLLAQIRDPKAKVALLNFMVDRYPGLNELARPLALKIWVMFRELLKKDPLKEVANAKEREGDYWEDAAIFAIERLGYGPEHEKYLRKLHSRTTNPLTQQRISALLGRMPARERGSK